MPKSTNSQIQECFDSYKESIFNIDHDIRFWKHFLKISIDSFLASIDREVSTAIFTVYDLQYDKIAGCLKTHEKIYKINASELQAKSNDFFTWVMNLSILNAYNSMEVLILQAIQIKYYPDLKNPIDGKKQTDKIQRQIKNYLEINSVKVNTKNNNHIIQFLVLKSPKIKSFLNLNMNTDLQTKWIDFFHLLSILRNTIAHCTMVVQPEVHNEIKSISKDIFQRYFEIKRNRNGLWTLNPRIEIFNNFLHQINSLTINLYKLIFDESNLSFIGMR